MIPAPKLPWALRAAIAGVVALLGAAAYRGNRVQTTAAKPITLAEVEAAEAAWYNGYINIPDEAAVEAFCIKMYAFDEVATMLKPTTKPVTTTKQGCIDYFKIAGIGMYGLGLPDDTAFKNEAFINDPVSGNAFVNGKWYGKMKSGEPSGPFDFTLGFVRVGDGIKLFLHHNVMNAWKFR